MNQTLKNLLTNPFVIGGTALGLGITAGAIIYGKKRPKTEAEIALEKEREANAQSLKLREMEIKKSLDELTALEETKRQAKEQEEKTKRAELELERLKERNIEIERQRQYEANAPQGYWDREIAKVQADGERDRMTRELESKEKIARIEADATKSAAESQARAAKEMGWQEVRRQESADRTKMAQWQAGANIVSSALSNKLNN